MGVPYLLGTSSRGHALSKLLAVIKDNEEAYEKVADIWVLGSGASLEQQAVGLRFLYVTLNCWGYQASGVLCLCVYMCVCACMCVRVLWALLVRA